MMKNLLNFELARWLSQGWCNGHRGQRVEHEMLTMKMKAASNAESGRLRSTVC